MAAVVIPPDWILAAVSGACALAVLRYTSGIRARNTALERRNAQLVGEKEKIAWENQLCARCSRDLTRPIGCNGTLGVMQDQAVTDAAVSCAGSVDTLPPEPLFTRQLPMVEPAPRSETTVSVRAASVTSSLVRNNPSLCASSVMDTHSEAAAKDITRAPVMPKDLLLNSPLKTRSNPGA